MPMKQGRRYGMCRTLAAVAIAGAWSGVGLFAPAAMGAQDERAAAAKITDVESLLDALERADIGIKTFSSELIYDRRFRLQGDRHIRWGSLYFQVEHPAAAEATGKRAQRTFAVRFETLMIPDEQGAVRHDDQSLWIFDGQWLIEKRDRERQFVKRQIARPEDPIDPLRLGEGPLPIPIGQKKADILERYDAVLLAPMAGLEAPEGGDPSSEDAAERASLGQFVADAYQLKLVPKGSHAEQDEFREVRLWYTRDGLLPRAARTINRAGDQSLVLLAGAQVNAALPPDVMDVEVPDPAKGWAVQIDEGRYGRDGDRDAQAPGDQR